MSFEEPSSQPAVLGGFVCASGADKCLQPWAPIDDDSSTCNRCIKALHPPCAAIDATKVLAGLVENPDSIRICHICLLPGEIPNNFGVFSAENGRLAKQPKTSSEVATATLIGASADSESPQSMADLDWPTLLKPHPTIHNLVEEHKVCPPQATKKTIWWRLYHTWNMEEFGSEVDQPISYCNLCGHKVKLSKVDRSPTPLKRHLQMQHQEVFKIMNQQKLKDGPVLSPPGSGAKTYYKSKAKGGKKDVNRTSHLKAITQWIIETGQPLDVVEADSFRMMTAALVGSPQQLNVFTKDAVVQYMSYLVLSLRHKMKELLACQSVIHVHEHWTSDDDCSYEVDRAHWIDENFNLQKCVVACDFATTMAQGEAASARWDSVDVVREKQILGTVSTRKDDDDYNAVGKPFLYHGVEWELDQIAELAYEALGSNIRDLVSRMRKLVESVHSSVLSSNFLVKAQQELPSFFPKDQSPLPLILDILPDRWWSTNEMIGRLLYLRKALEYLKLDSRLEDAIELPSKQEWETLENLRQAWEPFSIASQLLQKQKFVTISLVPMILQIVGEDLNPDGLQPGKIKTCINTMLSAWEERFGPNFPADPFCGWPKHLWMAHALDPRFKGLDILLDSSTTAASKDVVFDAVLEQMILLKIEQAVEDLKQAATTNDHPAATTTEASVADPAQLPAKKQKISAPPSSELRALASSRIVGGSTQRTTGLDSSRRLSSTAISSSSSSKSKRRLGSSATIADDSEIAAKIKEECQIELNAYKAAEGMKMWTVVQLEDKQHNDHHGETKDLHDPLPWWKEQHGAFPTVWKVARRYLAIPATCAPPERAFDAEAHSALVQRYCQAQASGSTPEMKLLKENAEMVGAFEEQQPQREKVDDKDGAKSETKGKGDDEQRTLDNEGDYDSINKVEV